MHIYIIIIYGMEFLIHAKLGYYLVTVMKKQS